MVSFRLVATLTYLIVLRAVISELSLRTKQRFRRTANLVADVLIWVLMLCLLLAACGLRAWIPLRRRMDAYLFRNSEYPRGRSPLE
jgi:hypothetical protein